MTTKLSWKSVEILTTAVWWHWPDLSQQALSVKGTLLYYQRSENCINKTPQIISINLANIRLLNIKKKKRKKQSCVITSLSCVYVYTHSIGYCIKFIDLFVLWVFASVINWCFMNWPDVCKEYWSVHRSILGEIYSLWTYGPYYFDI